MSVVVRDWREDDLDFYIEVRLEWDPTTGEDHLRRVASGQAAPFIDRAVAESEGHRVGLFTLTQPGVSDELMLHVLVPAAEQNRGFGSALFQRAARAQGTSPIATFVYDNDERSLAVIQHWGFTVTSHAIESRLLAADLPAPTPLPDGFTSRTFVATDITEDEAPELDRLIAASSTHPEAVELGWTFSVELFHRMFPTSLWTVFYDGDRAIAMSSVDPQPGRDWAIMFTCVDPDYRGQHLSTIVKQHLHSECVSRGATSFVTWNEERNEGIRALNASLGYRITGGEYRLRRDPS